jgi:hypothetical protein
MVRREGSPSKDRKPVVMVHVLRFPRLVRSAGEFLEDSHLAWSKYVHVGRWCARRTCVEGKFKRRHAGGKARRARLGLAAFKFAPAHTLHVVEYEGKRVNRYCNKQIFSARGR